MKCKKVKALIMDYIDGELSQRLSRDIGRHLDICVSCKGMEQSLRQAIIEPLRQAKQVNAPDRAWYRLKEVIINKKQRFFLADLIAQWSGYFQIRRPVLVPVAAMAAVILLVSVFFFNRTPTTQDTLNVYLQEQAGFVWQLAENGEESYLGIDEVSFGTSIEEYFL